MYYCCCFALLLAFYLFVTQHLTVIVVLGDIASFAWNVLCTLLGLTVLLAPVWADIFVDVAGMMLQ